MHARYTQHFSSHLVSLFIASNQTNIKVSTSIWLVCIFMQYMYYYLVFHLEK